MYGLAEEKIEAFEKERNTDRLRQETKYWEKERKKERSDQNEMKIEDKAELELLWLLKILGFLF